MYKSGQGLTVQSGKKVLSLSTLFECLGKNNETGLYEAQVSHDTQFLESGCVTLSSSIFISSLE